MHDPLQAREMDLQDIKNLRKWHKDAAIRAVKAGFDIVYVYAGHQLSTISHFLSPYRNRRSDQYGGSLENRARLLREILADTKDAVGHTCGVAIRFAVDELKGSMGFTSTGEGHDLIEMLAEEPDLWDVNISSWEHDSATSRFKQSGYQDDYVSFVKKVTSKPVVGVGRYTSPDAMVSLVKSGQLDMIGAARPSIADPFLPRKIEEGRVEDIRECIGCNICVSGDESHVPIRCTQNPTMGEEWRRGWHPERIQPKTSDERVLIIGAGPAGLEAARALGQRGYDVTIAEKSTELGGRVAKERRLPGFGEWGRVVDYREYQIKQMTNVDLYLNSEMTPDTLTEFEADHVVIATGSKWASDGIGRENPLGIKIDKGIKPYTPDDIFAGYRPKGPVVLFDDDHFYMGGAIAELLRKSGCDVTIVTPASEISSYTAKTLEQHAIQKRLLELGVSLETAHNLRSVSSSTAEIECIYTGRVREIECFASVLVTMRTPIDTLWKSNPNLDRIGDVMGPSTIAAAIYSGHLYAQELGSPTSNEVPFRRELIDLSMN
jgi:dimethylamine/trimethylamine dehydrogenase